MKKLRTYNTNTREYFLYKEMHEKQTLEFVEGKTLPAVAILEDRNAV